MKADGDVVFMCTDKGLSSFNGRVGNLPENENEYSGKVLITMEGETPEIDAPLPSPTNLPSESISRAMRSG